MEGGNTCYMGVAGRVSKSVFFELSIADIAWPGGRQEYRPKGACTIRGLPFENHYI